MFAPFSLEFYLNYKVSIVIKGLSITNCNFQGLSRCVRTLLLKCLWLPFLRGSRQKKGHRIHYKKPDLYPSNTSKQIRYFCHHFFCVGTDLLRRILRETELCPSVTSHLLKQNFQNLYHEKKQNIFKDGMKVKYCRKTFSLPLPRLIFKLIFEYGYKIQYNGQSACKDIEYVIISLQ